MLRRCIAQLLALVLSLLLHPLAFAAPEASKIATPHLAALQQAKQLMQDGRPAQAYALLEVFEFEQAGDVDFDYLIGIAALDSGRADKATLALERVLARDPNLAGARLDMARAWYVLGDYERARAELAILEAQKPPEGALLMIQQLYKAIDNSQQKTRRSWQWNAHLEVGMGFDNNVTNAVSDFTRAIEDSYGIPDYTPTGASILRSSPIYYLQAELELRQRLRDNLTLEHNLDARWRTVPQSSSYASLALDWRPSLEYQDNANRWRLGMNLQRAWQKTEASPLNRHTQGIYGQWLRAVGEENQLSLTLSTSRNRYPASSQNDGRSSGLTLAWLHQFQGSWRPYLHTSLSYNFEDARYPTALGFNNDKNSYSLRLFAQATPHPDLDIGLSFAYTQRRDMDSYTRGVNVMYGHDHISDLNLNLDWQFKPEVSLRAQWNYSRNDANIPLYQYRRHEVSVALRYEFE